MKQETISIEQLFSEEATALAELVEELESQQDEVEMTDTEYWDLQEEIVRLQYTIEYFALRLEGYYAITERPDSNE